MTVHAEVSIRLLELRMEPSYSGQEYFCHTSWRQQSLDWTSHGVLCNTIRTQYRWSLILSGWSVPGGSGILAPLVIKMCKIYGEMSQSSGTPWGRQFRTILQQNGSQEHMEHYQHSSTDVGGVGVHYYYFLPSKYVYLTARNPPHSSTGSVRMITKRMKSCPSTISRMMMKHMSRVLKRQRMQRNLRCFPPST